MRAYRLSLIFLINQIYNLMKKVLKISLLFFCFFGISFTIKAQAITSPKMMKVQKHENVVPIKKKNTVLELKIKEITEANQEVLNHLKHTDTQKYKSLLQDLKKIASLENELIFCKKSEKNQKVATIKTEIEDLKQLYNLK